jgi:hypothetical protein
MSDDVRLRDVEDEDLERFFEQEHDAEAVRRSMFAPRDRERFITRWATRILGDADVFVQAVTVDGGVAGHVVAWWEQRFPEALRRVCPTRPLRIRSSRDSRLDLERAPATRLVP